jgi:hypothetical protein
MRCAIVAGALANKPMNGGEAWVRLSWLLGLTKLGFDVWFVEELRQRDPIAEAWSDRVLRRFGLDKSSALIVGDSDGEPPRHLIEMAGEADLLVNISGHLTNVSLLRRIKTKVFVDLDPGFTHLWHAAGIGTERLAGHDYYFTVGTAAGSQDSLLPGSQFEWRPIFPPCVLSEWPVVVTASDDRDRFTTIASWRGPYGRVEYGGRTYGIKLDEFRKFITLPNEAPLRFELALDIHADDRKDLAALNSNGWKLVEPSQVAADPDSFRSYVQGSGAEFSVAQGIYVETASGWFSDRTTRYLASGKPALVQETGFSKRLPTGDGLLSFRTLDEARVKAEAIVRDYDDHAKAARRIATEYFDSDKVLGQMLDQVGL